MWTEKGARVDNRSKKASSNLAIYLNARVCNRRWFFALYLRG